MKITILAILIFLSLSSKVLAQNRVGNGGDVIVCSETAKKSKVDLLDFYEAEGKQIESTKPYAEIVKGRIDFLKQLSPDLGRQYLERWLKVQKDVDFRSDIELVDVKDSNHLFEPTDKRCQLKQIAIRRNITSDNQKRFIVSLNYWKQMQAVHQAGLLMHEMIYEHFFQLGENDSVKARAFNAFLFSPDFEKANPDDLWKFIKNLKIPIYRK
jgi:hypothetical protein